MFVGNTQIVEFFKGAIDSGHLGHAYCFAGLNQIGKRTLAKQLATQILSTTLEKLDSHPDFHYIERLTDEKTGKLKKDISISQAREIKSRLQNRSWLGGYQVVVLEEAELLNEESANSLLKILEEPSAQSVLFLLAENEAALLPTIRSRCQTFYFSLVSKKEIADGLVIEGCEEERAKEIAEISWGRPGKAINYWRDSEKLNNYYLEKDRWEKIIYQSFSERLTVAEELFNEKSDFIKNKEKLQEILDVWTILGREGMLKQIKSDTAGILSATQWSQLIDSLREAKNLLDQNINQRLLMEKVLLF
ncbi:MAG: polymerase III, delta prime subunit protein [Candidatus Magasanikbacteria bacterium GW2011_GWA2_37_8]|uniref:Polymerase III, delta prime subunit protein n=1 Tax=Candidatus Magasanikbacteria bacterium GW2011_GWA2_37_8 TaxID=1619036 RepID=A0A0G0KK12_9BACT|nr:MAG: polymerase III, delta prime subunit protein [Candidatus Magasanikbacteria bacterium GW2011_GWA2_37_8]